MTRYCWWIVGSLSRMLEPDERDAVCGDIAESGESACVALRDLLSLIVRRQAALWNDWRPWLIFVGLVTPLGVLLSSGSRMMAFRSAIPVWMYVNNWTMAYLASPGARRDLVDNGAAIFEQYLMLACWSWAGGFLLGSLSRRTIRVNGAIFCLIVLFAEWLEDPAHLLPARTYDGNSAVFSPMFYRIMFPLILQAVLVLLPSVWGMYQGLRLVTLPPLLRGILWASAIATIAALAIQNCGWVLCTSGRLPRCRVWSIPVSALSLAGPVAYMVATVVWPRWLCGTIKTTC